MLIQFGDIPLQTKGLHINGISKQIGSRWETHQVLQGPPILQYLGPEQSILNIDALLPVTDQGSMELLIRIEQAISSAQPHILMDALGNNLEKWVMTKVQQSQKIFDAQGIPYKITLNIELQRYGNL